MRQFIPCLALLVCSISSQALADQEQPPWQQGNEGIATGNYLRSLQVFEQYLANNQPSPLTQIASDYLAYYQSYLGAYQQAQKIIDQHHPIQPWGSASAAEGQPQPALDAILAQAAQQQAIFINEAHHMPQHRAFSLQLLKGLYQQGYRYFAAETFALDQGLNQRGYPLRGQSGYFTDEPVFGDLTRSALKMGYKLIPYEQVSACSKPEDPAFCQNERESVQAQNLNDRIFKLDPKAKVLVHAGYGHIDEKGSNGWVPMAASFKKLTGINPWTLDQVEMSEHSAPEFESPFYLNTLRRFTLKQPTLFRQTDGSYWSGLYQGAYDALIVHPRSVYSQGRPDWLLMGGQRGLHPIDAAICRQQLPCLVQAFVSGESSEAVPIDQYLIQAPAAAALALPRGSFQIRALNSAGQELSRFALQVK